MPIQWATGSPPTPAIVHPWRAHHEHLHVTIAQRPTLHYRHRSQYHRNCARAGALGSDLGGTAPAVAKRLTICTRRPHALLQMEVCSPWWGLAWPPHDSCHRRCSGYSYLQCTCWAMATVDAKPLGTTAPTRGTSALRAGAMRYEFCVGWRCNVGTMPYAIYVGATHDWQVHHLHTPWSSSSSTLSAFTVGCCSTCSTAYATGRPDRLPRRCCQPRCGSDGRHKWSPPAAKRANPLGEIWGLHKHGALGSAPCSARVPPPLDMSVGFSVEKQCNRFHPLTYFA